MTVLPFRGLFPFRDDDQEFFFGREDLITRLTSRMKTENFLAVLGPSGSGKSSVVMAGLIPALRQAYPDLKDTYMTPGSSPLKNFQTALQKGGYHRTQPRKRLFSD